MACSEYNTLCSVAARPASIGARCHAHRHHGIMAVQPAAPDQAATSPNAPAACGLRRSGASVGFAERRFWRYAATVVCRLIHCSACLNYNFNGGMVVMPAVLNAHAHAHVHVHVHVHVPTMRGMYALAPDDVTCTRQSVHVKGCTHTFSPSRKMAKKRKAKGVGQWFLCFLRRPPAMQSGAAQSDASRSQSRNHIQVTGSA